LLGSGRGWVHGVMRRRVPVQNAAKWGLACAALFGSLRIIARGAVGSSSALSAETPLRQIQGRAYAGPLHLVLKGRVGLLILRGGAGKGNRASGSDAMGDGSSDNLMGGSSSSSCTSSFTARNTATVRNGTFEKYVPGGPEEGCVGGPWKVRDHEQSLHRPPALRRQRCMSARTPFSHARAAGWTQVDGDYGGGPDGTGPLKDPMDALLFPDTWTAEHRATVAPAPPSARHAAPPLGGGAGPPRAPRGGGLPRAGGALDALRALRLLRMTLRMKLRCLRRRPRTWRCHHSPPESARRTGGLHPPPRPRSTSRPTRPTPRRPAQARRAAARARAGGGGPATLGT
jgi:hypothetical protein